MPNLSDAQAERLLKAWPQILAELAAGKPVQAFVRSLGFDPTSVYALRLRYPQCDAEWLKAHEESADAIFDRFMQLLDGEPKDQVEAAWKRTQLDKLQWAAAKRKPSQYSDKTQLDVNVKTVDMTAIVNAAAARLAAHRVPEITVTTPNSGALLSASSRADSVDAELVRSLADLQ